jgi:hypothetical protein
MVKRAKQPTVSELAVHARKLARAFGARLKEDPALTDKPHMAQALLFTGGEKIVHCAPIVNEATYAIVLHEIGHGASALGGGDLSNAFTELQALTKENAAWDWAREYSLYWTNEMEQTARLSLGSYEQAAERAKAQQVANERNALRNERQVREWSKKLKL